MNEDLKKFRAQWEKGLTPLSIMDQPELGRALVILQRVGKSVETSFHCHRYFTIGKDWAVSVDGQGVSLKAVWAWLSDPQPRSVQMADMHE
jgi:hypothetical protein